MKSEEDIKCDIETIKRSIAFIQSKKGVMTIAPGLADLIGALESVLGLNTEYTRFYLGRIGSLKKMLDMVDR